MHRSLLAAVALAVAAALLAPATAQSASPFSVVGANDPMDQRPLGALLGRLAYMDADADGQADATVPEEPIYLDLDGSAAVSYGDLRLTHFLDYPAGTSVDASNRDVGRTLATATGWIGSTPQGHWFADLDGGRTVTAGDLRLDGTFGSRVGASDSELRTGLQPIQQQQSETSRISYLDGNSNGRHDASEAVYFDVDNPGTAGSGRVSTGDLRMTPTGPGLEDTVSRAEFEQALDKAGVQQQNGSYERTTTVEKSSSWGTPETVLLVLAVVNLAGLVFVYRAATAGRPPRNPFK